MKVLIVSTNTLDASPTGPAYIAGAAMRAGHTVEVFESLFSADISADLQSTISRFQPDVIGVSIRLVHAYVNNDIGPYFTQHVDLRPRVRLEIDAIRAVTDARIILGGPGFNYYAKDWLEYLDLEYGIRGEADFSFPLFLERFEKGGDLSTVPGCIIRRNGKIFKAPRDRVRDLDQTAFPAYELFDLDAYQQHGIPPGILTKRGCVFQCTFCPYHSLEGKRYRLKSPVRVVDEVEHIRKYSNPKMVTFCENNFNVPKKHAVAICHEMNNRSLDIPWGTGVLRPMGIDDAFCELMKASGCIYLSLSVESASERMLRSMKRGYTTNDVRQSIACLIKSGIPFGVSLMVGAPGETPETIHESISLIDEYDIPLGTWVTSGICLWTHHQALLAEARQAGQLTDGQSLFDAPNYLSSSLPKSYMLELIAMLKAKKGYDVQVNQPYAGYQWEN